MPTLVEIKNLSKRYTGSNSGCPPTLDGLDLSLEVGKIIDLLGENSSGKTTLLKIFAGVLGSTAGTVTITGQPIGPKTETVTSYLPGAAWLPDATRIDVAIAQHADCFANFQADKARGLAQFLGLGLKQKTNHMSKGVRERLQLTLVMSREARLYLLSEPISGVDPAARQTLLDTIMRGWNPDSTLFISTHLVTDIETVMGQAVFLHTGKLLMNGDADELRKKYGLSLDQIFRKEYSHVRQSPEI